MIAKRIDRESGQGDNYRCLGLYIADASHEGEKLLERWYTGCLAENYQEALMEIELTQSLNTRSDKGKTYHLMISFRPEDESKLTREVYQDIEQTIASTLGFEEHQRLCGVHKNTANVHMHVAYNMIHPEKLTRHEPFRDFYKLSDACRELEQKYGLEIDNGVTKGKEPTRVNQRVASMEAHSGQQSFQSYVQERKSFIFESLTKANNWQELQKSLATKGMEVKLQGNGIAVVNRYGKGAIKGSAIDRSFTKSRLVKQLGSFTVGQALNEVQSEERYTARPLQKASNRDKLYEEYLLLMQQRQKSIELAKTSRVDHFDPVRKKWVTKYQELKMRIMAKSTKRALFKVFKEQQHKEYAAAHTKYQESFAQVREEYPFSNWNDFLKMKAEHGNQTALAILRSKKEVVQPDKSADNQVQGTRTIDNKGTVIMALPSGGTVRDTGKEINFSAHDKAAEEVALQYAKKKWGQHVNFANNKIVQSSNHNKNKKHGHDRGR